MGVPGGQDSPLYQQIAHVLREEITAGKLAPGAAVPTEKELADQYGVSRNTVRLALSALTNEGLITGGRGRGRVVRRREPLIYYASRSESNRRRNVSEVDAFMQDVKEQGRSASQTIEVGILAAPPDIAHALEIEPGTTVVVRRRLRFVDGQPWSTADSYYPLSAVEGTAILNPADIPQGVNRLLAELGHEQTHYVDELTVRMPDPNEAQRLDIGSGVPVLIQTRVGYTARGPVRVAVAMMPGDRHRVIYECPA
jgi:GntR family transcriptional regulator